MLPQSREGMEWEKKETKLSTNLIYLMSYFDGKKGKQMATANASREKGKPPILRCLYLGVSTRYHFYFC